MWGCGERRRGGKGLYRVCIRGLPGDRQKGVCLSIAPSLSLYLSPYCPPIIYPSSLCIYLSIAIVSVLPSVCLSVYLFIYLKRFIVRNWNLLWRLQASPSALQAETPRDLVASLWDREADAWVSVWGGDWCPSSHSLRVWTPACFLQN